MARKYTRMRITHIDIYRLSLFMSGAKFLLWCARALSLAHSGFSRSLSHSLGLTPRFIPRSLTRSLPPTLAHWFPYTPLSRAVRMVGVGGGKKKKTVVQRTSVHVHAVSAIHCTAQSKKVGSGAATLP